MTEFTRSVSRKIFEVSSLMTGRSSDSDETAIGVCDAFTVILIHFLFGGASERGRRARLVDAMSVEFNLQL